jgi:hypothetical protein
MQTEQRSEKTYSQINLSSIVLLLIMLALLTLSGCSSTGTCVGSGGNVLLSPVCKDDWTRAECGEWDAEEINGAQWKYNGGKTCEGLGYTDRCSDGSFRLPGGC